MSNNSIKPCHSWDLWALLEAAARPLRRQESIHWDKASVAAGKSNLFKDWRARLVNVHVVHPQHHTAGSQPLQRRPRRSFSRVPAGPLVWVAGAQLGTGLSIWSTKEAMRPFFLLFPSCFSEWISRNPQIPWAVLAGESLPGWGPSVCGPGKPEASALFWYSCSSFPAHWACASMAPLWRSQCRHPSAVREGEDSETTQRGA